MNEVKILKRSRDQKWIAGFCGRVGAPFHVDLTIVYLVLIFVMIATGILPLAATCLFAWVIVTYPTVASILRFLISRSKIEIPAVDHYPSTTNPNRG